MCSHKPTSCCHAIFKMELFTVLGRGAGRAHGSARVGLGTAVLGGCSQSGCEPEESASSRSASILGSSGLSDVAFWIAVVSVKIYFLSVG